MRTSGLVFVLRSLTQLAHLDLGHYDKSALIPEVTQVVRSVSDTMTSDVSKSGKTAVCDRYGRQLTSVGFLRTR
jgi:hypothetical protein